MSMLDSLRRGTDSTSTRIILLVAIALFAFWGVGSGGGSARSSTYATVNGVEIEDVDFRRMFQARMRTVGRNLEGAERDELAQKVLDDLIAREAVLQEADRVGIRVHDEEIARRILQEESFRGEDGKFNEKIYKKALKAQGLTDGSFRTLLRDEIRIERLTDIARAGVSVSEAEVKKSWEAENTSITLQFVRLAPSAFLADVTITDAERDAWASTHGDAIKARYDQDFERRYNLPKRYTLSSIVLRTDIPGVPEEDVKQRAEAVRATAAGGADFAELAKRWSEDLTAVAGGSLGTQAAAQLDAAIVTAVDAAGAGKITEVVRTSRGFQVLRVEAIEDAKVVSLDEARSDIATTLLRDERLPAAIETFQATFLAAWKERGSLPTDLLEARKLVVEDTGPFSPTDGTIPKIGENPALQSLLAGAAAGDVFPVAFDVRGSKTLVGVSARSAADPATYADARTMVRARLSMQAWSAFEEAWVKDLVTRAEVVRNTSFVASN